LLEGTLSRAVPFIPLDGLEEDAPFDPQAIPRFHAQLRSKYALAIMRRPTITPDDIGTNYNIIDFPVCPVILSSHASNARRTLIAGRHALHPFILFRPESRLIIWWLNEWSAIHTGTALLP
jgi:hypothetical protein